MPNLVAAVVKLYAEHKADNDRLTREEHLERDAEEAHKQGNEDSRRVERKHHRLFLMALLDWILVLDRNHLGRLLRSNRRLHRSQTVVKIVSVVHRAEERQHRRMEEIAVIEILKQARRNAERNRPNKNSPRVGKLAPEHFGQH